MDSTIAEVGTSKLNSQGQICRTNCNLGPRAEASSEDDGAFLQEHTCRNIIFGSWLCSCSNNNCPSCKKKSYCFQVNYLICKKTAQMLLTFSFKKIDLRPGISSSTLGKQIPSISAHLLRSQMQTVLCRSIRFKKNLLITSLWCFLPMCWLLAKKKKEDKNI